MDVQPNQGGSCMLTGACDTWFVRVLGMAATAVWVLLQIQSSWYRSARANYDSDSDQNIPDTCLWRANVQCWLSIDAESRFD